MKPEKQTISVRVLRISHHCAVSRKHQRKKKLFHALFALWEFLMFCNGKNFPFGGDEK